MGVPRSRVPASAAAQRGVVLLLVGYVVDVLYTRVRLVRASVRVVLHAARITTRRRCSPRASGTGVCAPVEPINDIKRAAATCPSLGARQLCCTVLPYEPRFCAYSGQHRCVGGGGGCAPEWSGVASTSTPVTTP